MMVVDSHRLLGPVPMDSTTESEDDLIRELDHLGIQSAAVTPSWMVFGDPRDADAYQAERSHGSESERLVRVPVVIPGVAGSGWPKTMDAVDPALMIRACPERHRFDALGPTARGWWRHLADRGIVLAMDAGECGLRTIAAVAESSPTLNIFALTPGYRELRRLTELLQVAPNVHIETGTIASAGGVEWLARTVGAHRLMFGTGAPVWDDAGPRFQLDHLDLPEADIAMIAHGTWDRLTTRSA